jgi:multidrug efflux system membrane fusion protein
MRVRRSYLFAGAIALVVVGYFGVSAATGGAEKDEKKAEEKKDEPQLVRVLEVPESARPDRVLVRGRTEAPRSVVVRAETAGIVSAAPVAEGAFVRAGQVLCRLDVDARAAALQQARANFQAEKLQYEASARLAERGFRAQSQVLQDRAQMDGAAAQVRAAEVAIDQVNVRAPFSGVFNDRQAEVGSYLAPGQPCGTVVEINPILFVGDVTEDEAGKIGIGAPANVKLGTGQGGFGKVRFISREADPETRTYRVEVVSPNPGGAIRSGLSAEISLATGTANAHLVPVTALVLDSAGRQGVRYVQGVDRVAFAPVRVLEETPEGAWVAGLAGATRVITVGQSFVSEGEKVRVAFDKVQVAAR